MIIGIDQTQNYSSCNKLNIMFDIYNNIPLCHNISPKSIISTPRNVVQRSFITGAPSEKVMFSFWFAQYIIDLTHSLRIQTLNSIIVCSK